MNQPPRGLMKTPDFLNDALSQDKTKKFAVEINEPSQTPEGFKRILDILADALSPDEKKKLVVKVNKIEKKKNKNSTEKPTEK